MKKIIILSLVLSFNFAVAQNNKSASILQFGAKGDGVSDDYNSFLLAVNSGFNVIKLEAKTYYIDNLSGDRLSKMLVLHNILFEGVQGTTIKFNYNGLPLFTFINSQQGGFKNINFLYTGDTQLKADFTTLQFVQKLQLKVILSPYELSSILFASNCNNLNLLNLSFRSQTINDSTKAIGMCINVKSKDELPAAPTFGLKISNVIFNNCDMGMLIEGQHNFSITKIESEGRFGSLFFPPGHVIYLTATGRNEININGRISDIYDYGNPVNLAGRCLATLALKNLDSCVIDNIVTLHPEGIAQSFYNMNNCKVSDLIWIKNDAAIPAAPFMYFTGEEPIANNSFNNIIAFSPNKLINIFAASSSVKSMTNNVFTNIYAYTNLNFKEYGRGVAGFLDINGQNNSFDKVYIETSDKPDNEKTNSAVFWRNASSLNHANVTMKGKNANIWSTKMAATTLNANSNQININNEQSGFNSLYFANKASYSSLNFTKQGSVFVSKLNLPAENGKQILFINFKLSNGKSITNSYLYLPSVIDNGTYKVIPLKMETQPNSTFITLTRNQSNFVVSISSDDYNQYSNSSISYSWLTPDNMWPNVK